MSKNQITVEDKKANKSNNLSYRRYRVIGVSKDLKGK